MSGPTIASAAVVNARALDMRLYNMQQQIAALMTAVGVAIPETAAVPVVPPPVAVTPEPEPTPTNRQRTVLLD